MTALAIFLIGYGIAVIAIAFLKPAPIWNLGKIQGFVKALTERGTVIFFIVWGAAALIAGIVILT